MTEFTQEERTQQKNTQAKNYRDRKLGQGICISTGCWNALEEPHVLCETCRQKMTEQSRKRRKQWKKQNLCIQCGKRANIYGSVFCPLCRETNGIKDPLTMAIRRELKEHRDKEEDRIKQVEMKAEQKQMKALFPKLSANEKEIFDLKYGLKDGQYRTYQEVADIMGVSRQRIHQIVIKAKAPLRHNSN